MLKKTREKINNNQYVIIFKKFWSNKRYRSILILVLYFIFFGIVISATTTKYDNEVNIQEEIKKETIVDKINNWNNYNDNYAYNIDIEDEEAVNIAITNNIMTIVYKDLSYTMINNDIYLNSGDDLKKVDSIGNLVIPVKLLNITSLMNYVKSINYISYEDNVITYDISGYYSDDNNKNIFAIIKGYDKLESISFKYNEQDVVMEVEDDNTIDEES